MSQPSLKTSASRHSTLHPAVRAARRRLIHLRPSYPWRRSPRGYSKTAIFHPHPCTTQSLKGWLRQTHARPITRRNEHHHPPRARIEMATAKKTAPRCPSDAKRTPRISERACSCSGLHRQMSLRADHSIKGGLSRWQTTTARECCHPHGGHTQCIRPLRQEHLDPQNLHHPASLER